MYKLYANVIPFSIKIWASATLKGKEVLKLVSKDTEAQPCEILRQTPGYIRQSFVGFIFPEN